MTLKGVMSSVFEYSKNTRCCTTNQLCDARWENGLSFSLDLNHGLSCKVLTRQLKEQYFEK